MIPQRIQLTGFLSYKDVQEIPFQGANVWLLAGLNGSGKSSVFDALTYALFGHHRGGSQNAIELINKESNALTVEFDFTLDGVLHRIRRTLKRSSRGNATGTQQLFRHTGSALGLESGWEAVPDTNKKVDFDDWIHNSLGLNYETFTSSVLLLQGKAEKLLDSKPSGRAEVLAGIVDLERYQRLHDKANQQKLAFKGQLDSLSHQTSAVPEVSDFDYALALEAIDRAEEERDRIRVGIDTLHLREAQARQWAELNQQWQAAQQRLRQTEMVLASAVTIEKEAGRLTELKAVLPAVQTVVTTRSKLQESDRRTERYQKDRQEAQERKSLAEGSLVTAKNKRDTLKKQMEQNETQLQDVGLRLRELWNVVRNVQSAEELEAELRRRELELAQFGPDPQAAVASMQQEVDRLDELSRVWPALQRFHDERNELRAAGQRLVEITRRSEATELQGKQRKAANTQLNSELTVAREARVRADEQVVEASVVLSRAREQLKEFLSLQGQKSCQACGQPLTPSHFENEKKQRQRAVATAEQRHTLVVAQQAETVAAERTLSDQETQLSQSLVQLREEYLALGQEKRNTQSEIARLQKSTKITRAELPARFSERITREADSDESTTTFPDRDELSRLQHEAAGLEGAKRKLRASSDELDRWKQHRTHCESTQANLKKLQQSLPTGDRAKFRDELASHQASEVALTSSIKSGKRSLETAQTDIDRLNRDDHSASTTLTEIVGKLKTEEVTRNHCHEVIQREMEKLPPSWRSLVQKAGLTDYHTWAGELQDLTSRDTEGQFQKLQSSRVTLASHRAEVERLDRLVAEVPQESRIAWEIVKLQLDDARGRLEKRDRECQETQRRKMVYDGHREQRARLGEQFKIADAEHLRFKMLAELLGRDRLQRHLVRQAERQIVDYANAVLDRLSGGQLFLRLVGSDDGSGADRALELECVNRITGSAPINVMFLSGSQKFRVAVSLALGIGQYASRQHRPIESVIIDEGFGCLDRYGRQVMIQELQNLRGHLHCILLVSHQEEFADAFADGYRFELHEGSTKVTRFQR